MVRRFLHWLVSEHFGQILFAVLSVPVVPTLRRLDVFEAKERQVRSNLIVCFVSSEQVLCSSVE